MTDANACKEILKTSSCYYLCFKNCTCQLECIKKYFCRICSKKHHISICEERNKQSPDQNPNTAINLNRVEKGSIVFVFFSQSAVLQIENIDNLNYWTDGTVLFATGSQRSFVTESVGKRLKLPTLKKETMKETSLQAER